MFPKIKGADTLCRFSMDYQHSVIATQLRGLVLETLEQFELSTSQVVMFLIDGARIMSVGRLFSERGCRFLHVTSKVRALHLVAETIKQCFPNVDALIAGTKKVFLKPPKRLRAFHSKCPGISEPSQPILTRWAIWLKAAFYYDEYFQQIKAVILQFDPGGAADIKGSQTKLHVSVKTVLTITQPYKKIEMFGTAIETTVSLSLQFGVTELFIVIHSSGVTTNSGRSTFAATSYICICDALNEPVKSEFESVLKKDSCCTKLRQICDSASTDPLSECKEYFNYACITSVVFRCTF
ncbi:hypothetical protein NQ318_000747 [Aromia moschata]|uniref:Uncharacterized protein n=1 Tax=Aromia moschata TaxID=1265417 RepID=A0AAV8YV31_9CUCU|nr:hypothetical protein NQ318_000747 [Aromia moschata]